MKIPAHDVQNRSVLSTPLMSSLPTVRPGADFKLSLPIVYWNIPQNKKLRGNPTLLLQQFFFLKLLKIDAGAYCYLHAWICALMSYKCNRTPHVKHGLLYITWMCRRAKSSGAERTRWERYCTRFRSRSGRTPTLNPLFQFFRLIHPITTVAVPPDASTCLYIGDPFWNNI